VRRQQSRDSCDSVAFARPRARRALTGMQGLVVRPCPTPPGPRAVSVPGSRAAWAAFFCCRKVAMFRAWLCSAENRPLYSNLKRNARPAVFLNRTHQLYSTLGSQVQPKTFDFWIED